MSINESPEEYPNYEGDAAAPPTTAKLQEIAVLAGKLKEAEALVIELEAKLEKAEFTLNTVQGKDLPELLAEVGITDFTLEDGTKVAVAKLYAATISEERKTAAHKWLEDNKFGSLITRECVVELDKGDDKAKEALADWLSENLFRYQFKESVNWQTLQAFVKGQMESTDEKAVKPPLNLFGIFIADKATVKNKNQKTTKRIYKKK